MVNMAAAVLEKLPVVPDAEGRFGKFGGRYVPETLIFALTELEQAYKAATEDEEFQASLLPVCPHKPLRACLGPEHSPIMKARAG